LPEPLRKAPAVPLTARIRVPLPLGEGDIGVQLGQRVALRASAGDGAPAVRVLLGTGEVQAPAAGLVIEGRTPELAVMEWAGLVAAGTGSEGGEETTADPGLPLREVDVQVDRLLVGGGSFGSVHLANGTGEADAQLRFDGAAMAGTLTLPKAGGDALSGHFERLHWQRPEPGARTHAGPNEDDAVHGEGPEPALIPPIRISVGELRVDQALLGSATLHTRPVPGGMRIEQLETQSPLHHVVLSGEWTGRGAQARTRTQARVASGDFG